jgi:hypothetical protein
MRQRGILLLTLAITACEGTLDIDDPTEADAPTDLDYQLIPSGEPSRPLGVVLQWTPPSSGRALTYDIYGASNASSDFVLRGTTTSPSFHDAGIPQLEYFVMAMDADDRELGRTDAVLIDERNRLPTPRGLASVTLNRGVQLSWDDNAYEADPDGFDFYRVYSTVYDAVRGCDEQQWALEGSTVSEEFVSRGLTNGVTRCFSVSAISRDGHESTWSDVREDTPRYDARSIVLDASDVRRGSAGFTFSVGASGPFGQVVADSAPTADVVLERRDGALWLRAARTDVQIAAYGASPVSELTSIDRAPVVGYGDAVRVQAGYGYVARTKYADGTHVAALRVIHVAADYVLFDYAYQPLAGSPELSRAAP